MLVESDALGRYLYGHDLCVFVGERAHGQSRDDYKNSKQKIAKVKRQNGNAYRDDTQYPIPNTIFFF